MMIFADTADISEIKELVRYGLIDGITTNPTLIARTGRSFADTITEICDVVDGPVSAEVIAVDASAMIDEGRRLAALAPNVVVKLPLTLDGLMACQTLTDEGHETNVTLCFSAGQALLAAKAGASFISPFVGRLDDASGSGRGLDLIASIVGIYENYGYATNVLAASIRSTGQIIDCAERGAHAVTAPAKAIFDLAKHVLTDKGLDAFLADAKAANVKLA